MGLDVVYQLINSGLVVYILNESDTLYPALRTSILENTGTCVKRVGTGVKRSEFCGKVKFKVGCGKCRNEVKTVFHSCDRVLCPKCYRNAVKKQSKRISERINGMGEVYNLNNVHLGTLKHIVFSPPQFITREMYERDPSIIEGSLLEMIHRFTKDGFYGGVIMPHGERKKHKDGTECDDMNCEEEHVWVWGLHYHYIGYGYFEKSDKVHELTGWVYKQIANAGIRDVYSSVYYLLTHSTVFTHEVVRMFEGVECDLEERTIGQGYSYVGIFANCKGGNEIVSEDKHSVECDKCGTTLGCYFPDIDDKIDWDIWLKNYTEVIKTVKWYINGKAQKFISMVIDDFG